MSSVCSMHQMISLRNSVCVGPKRRWLLMAIELFSRPLQTSASAIAPGRATFASERTKKVDGGFTGRARLSVD